MIMLCEITTFKSKDRCLVIFAFISQKPERTFDESAASERDDTDLEISKRVAVKIKRKSN